MNEVKKTTNYALLQTQFREAINAAIEQYSQSIGPDSVSYQMEHKATLICDACIEGVNFLEAWMASVPW